MLRLIVTTVALRFLNYIDFSDSVSNCYVHNGWNLACMQLEMTDMLSPHSVNPPLARIYLKYTCTLYMYMHTVYLQLVDNFSKFIVVVFSAIKEIYV